MNFPKKILLVDYEPRAMSLVRQALEATGKYAIKEELDSRHAISAARWFQPNLILFDVAMTKPEGACVARQLQEDPCFRETPVVFLSVNTSEEGAVISGGILSGYSFTANPVGLDELIRYVAELLDMSAELTEAAHQIATR